MQCRTGEEVKVAVDSTVDAYGRLDFAFSCASVEPEQKPLDQVSVEE